MPSCIVKSCRNHSGSINKSHGITFHRFPSANDVWKNDWVKIIRECRNENNWHPAKSTVICSKHFEENSLYRTKGGLLRVVAYAVPTKFLFDSSTIQDQPTKEVNSSVSDEGLKTEDEDTDDEPETSQCEGQDPLNENECIVFCSQCNVEVPHAAGGKQEDPTKVLVANVYRYLEQEYEELKTLYGSVDLTPLSKISQRTAKATGVSEATVLQVLKEEEERRTVCQPAEELPKRAARKRTRETSSSIEDDSDENGDVEEQTRPQTPEETETLIVKMEPSEQYEGSEMIYTPFEVKLEPVGEASGSQVDPIAVEIQTEPWVYGGKRTNETLAPDVLATNKGRGRKRQRKDDETTQHTQGLTTARASSSVPTRDVDENSLLAEGAIKTEEIEIQQEGFS